MLKVASLFAGIGGFDLALEQLGHKIVYVNEWDKYAADTYQKNFGDRPDTRSISDVPSRDIPDHDLLAGGFPCQAFSIAGKRGGFNDTRGTMFFEIARIAKDKRPAYLLLENVKGLLSHDNGRTFETIMRTLDELGYDTQWQVLNSKNFGVPQNRERVFIIGHLRGERRPKVFPIRESDEGDNKQGLWETESVIAGTINLKNQFPQWQFDASTTLIAGRIDRNQFKSTKDESLCITANYWKGPDNHGQRTVVGTLRTFKDGNGLREVKSGLAPTLQSRAREDGSGQPVINQNMKIRRLTPVECERLQGFPDGWTEGVSDTQRYKQLGNAVTVNVVYEIAKRMFE